MDQASSRAPDPLDPEILPRVMRFLRCPRCGATMSFAPSLCKCDCGQSFTADRGLFAFGSKDFADKYDTAGMVTRYVKYAFGSSQPPAADVAPDGRSEALYRAVSDICRGELLSRAVPEPVVIDLACGVGRTVYDVASVCSRATVIGFDLSTAMARCASQICAGQAVLCGASEDGWPITGLRMPPLSNVFIAQADACTPPIGWRVTDDSAASLVVLSMLLDRLRTPREVEASLDSAAGALAADGVLVASTPFNWTTEQTWQRFGNSRTWLAEAMEKRDLTVEIYFDYLPYRECLDPFGTTLELPVQVCAARKRKAAE